MKNANCQLILSVNFVSDLFSFSFTWGIRNMCVSSEELSCPDSEKTREMSQRRCDRYLTEGGWGGGGGGGSNLKFVFAKLTASKIMPGLLSFGLGLAPLGESDSFRSKKSVCTPVLPDQMGSEYFSCVRQVRFMWRQFNAGLTCRQTLSDKCNYPIRARRRIAPHFPDSDNSEYCFLSSMKKLRGLIADSAKRTTRTKRRALLF